MRILALDGPYKGEVREFPAHIALRLIEEGKAVQEGETPTAEIRHDDPVVQQRDPAPQDRGRRRR